MYMKQDLVTLSKEGELDAVKALLEGEENIDVDMPDPKVSISSMQHLQPIELL